MTKITLHPDALNIKCCYTLLEPASHHDPDTGIGANMNLYRRQLIRMPYQQRGRELTQSWYPKIARAFPVPTECIDIFHDEPFERFIAIAIIKVFIENYTGRDEGEGEGIFRGIERYKRLTQRMEMAAPRAYNLKEFWAILIRDLKVTLLSDPSVLFQLLAVPSGCHHRVLYEIEKSATMIVEMARYWKESQTRGQTETVIDFHASSDAPLTETLEASVAVPCHSGNDIRHDIRYCGMVHLFSSLGLDLDTGLPTGVKALFENGGNIGKGVSAPSDSYALAQEIRKTYPILGLLGGCTDSFMLGDGNLHSVSPFYFGMEYNPALKSLFGIEATHSVVEMLDEWTLHRHSGRTHDQSPMPYAFEVVTAGAKLYVNFQFSPWTPDIELGAFVAALETYKNIDSTIGGQSAKGFGKVEVEYIEPPHERFHAGSMEYDNYLEACQDALVFGLKKGFLGTQKMVCT